MRFNTVLVVAAHPDDEVLGCGGTMAALARSGAKVRTLFVGTGVGSRTADDGVVNGLKLPLAPSAEVVARLDAARRANQLLGASIVGQGNFPDNAFDSVALLQIVKFVEAVVQSERPDLVITHHGGDLNVDHRQVHEAVVTVCRPQPGASVRGLLFFETASSTEWRAPQSGMPFGAQWFQDISSTLALKRAALEAYGAEMRAWPHARSIEAIEHLARWRGATVGVEAAEAFMVGRWLAGPDE